MFPEFSPTQNVMAVAAASKVKTAQQRYPENAKISEEDKERMVGICSSLGIAKGVHIALKLYGYQEHLNVYTECQRLVELPEARREAVIDGMTSSQLRDIKSKIKSAGKIGKKHEMKQGVVDKLREMRVYVDRDRDNGVNRKRHFAEMNGGAEMKVSNAKMRRY